MHKFILLFILSLASLLLIAACDDSGSEASKPTPEQVEAAKARETQPKYGPHQSPHQSPAQQPWCEDDDIDMIEMIPKFHWITFTLVKSSTAGTWRWSQQTSTDPLALFNWLAEDQDNLFIVGGFARKEHLQKVWNMFSDQIKMPNDIHWNLPMRNYNKIAFDDQADLVESMPEWFFPIALRLAKQMGN